MHRVLAVSHNSANHALLREALDGTFQIQNLEGDAIHLSGIIDATDKQHIDLVILDADLQDLDAMSVLESLQAEATTRDVPVVMITCAHMDSQTALALNKGAVDCLELPCSNMLIQARVRRACRCSPLTSSHGNEGGHLVAFIGAKGGVGTTTVTVNTGVALVERGLRVTMVDLRGYFGTMAAHLGVHPGDHPHNLAELLDEEAENITHDSVEQLLFRHGSGMKVLLGAQDGDGYHRVTSKQTESLVASLRGHADYTLFDLPPWPTEAVETVLSNCDQILLVLERDPASLHAAKVLLSTLISDGAVRGSVAAVIVNRAVVSTPILIDFVRKNLSCPIAAMIPPAADACAAAALSCEPLIQFRHDTDCAEALAALAERLTADRVPALTF